MLTKRLKVSILMGSLLGVLCIIGASIRFDNQRDALWLFALWYNRLLMGLVIGLPWRKISLLKSIVRGAILGLAVSFAYYSASGYTDMVSFLAGIVYGMIIEGAAYKFGRTGTKIIK